MTGRTVEQALACARHGWPVFPAQPGSKQPATRHGYLDATTDPGQITWWWRRQPDANLAIATGHPGPDVLDIDQHGPAGNGYPALNRLHRAGLVDGAAAVIATPSGGAHLYFTGSDQRCGKLPRHHIDFRAQGGYIIAPPSQVGGRRYQVVSRQAGTAGLDWAKVTRLLEPERDRAIQPGKAQPADLSHLATWVAGLGPDSHNRNDGLFWAACRAAEAGDDQLLDQLADAARTTGLTGREIAATIRSARRTARPAAERQAGREATS
jgi:Bifunctional DNA primase/polymerase, N-terminal